MWGWGINWLNAYKITTVFTPNWMTYETIKQWAWNKYGFRVGISGGNYDVSQIGIKGIPSTISSTTSGLKMDVYNKLIEELSN